MGFTSIIIIVLLMIAAAIFLPRFLRNRRSRPNEFDNIEQRVSSLEKRVKLIKRVEALEKDIPEVE